MGAAGPSTDLRVCHFSTTSLESKYFDTLGRGLASRGVTLFGATLSEPVPPLWLLDARGDYLFLNARSRAAYPFAVVKLARWLRRQRITVLQTHLFDAGLVGLMAARLAGVPLVIVTRHHADYHLVSGTRLHVLIDSWTARLADRVVVLSPAVRDHLMARERVGADRIDVIAQGFDFAALTGSDEDGRRVRRELGLDGKFVVGAVASFQPAKGHVHLLAAARDLVGTIPNLALLLVGGGDRAPIEARAREHGLGERVVFTGFRRDVAACIRAMDVVVHPSLSEAFCQAIIEGMAAERPVVATDVGSASDVVTDTVHGLLVPPADPGAIAAAVTRIHRDPAFGRRMAEAARRSVTERFTLESMVAKQVECYRRWLPASATRNDAGAAAGAHPV